MSANVISSGQKGQKGQNAPDPHVLTGRLNAGWLMIEAEPNPTKRERLEDHWLRLLHDYEAACDRADPRSGQKPGDRFSGIGGWT